VRAWRARRQWQALNRSFDQAAALPGAVERLAAVSELLRRAARTRDPAAASLTGEEWLRFLDRSIAGKNSESTEFSVGAGRLLLDGAYRRDLDESAVQALLAAARRSFLSMAQPR
jgi:hypothetical protein